MREAAAEAKPLIDAEAMASACEALGWHVTESLVGTMVEGDGAWECRKWLDKELKKVQGIDLADRSDKEWTENMVAITGSSYYAGRSGQKAMSSYTLVGAKEWLLKIDRALNRFTKVTGVGDLGCTVREIYAHKKRVRLPSRQVVDRDSGRFQMNVRVWVNLRSWAVANPKMKGTKKKPVTLLQPIKGIKALPATGIKAGQFWNSLYSRGISEDAEAYLKAQGADLPTEEDIDTPEERIKRTFDHTIKKVLEDFTKKQLAAVEKYFMEAYLSQTEVFLDKQAEIFTEW
jgi:hypothetical protein